MTEWGGSSAADKPLRGVRVLVPRGGKWGDSVSASLRWHPLALPLALAAAGALALALNEGITGRPTFRRAADRWGLPATVACFVLLAAVWAARVVLHPAWSPDPIRPGSLAARLLE